MELHMVKLSFFTSQGSVFIFDRRIMNDDSDLLPHFQTKDKRVIIEFAAAPQQIFACSSDF